MNLNLQQKQRTEEVEYNINNYTDSELLDILDLNNPSDRELEAKIVFLIRKYQNMQTIAATQLSNFFEKIYARFFEIEEVANEDDDSNIIEGFGDTSPSKPDIDNASLPINTQQPDTSITENKYSITTPTAEQSSNQTNTINTLYTKTLEYTPGKLNPLVQQTTRRVISIDSQYRDDKTSLSTEFTFNLTETLKDVVSLKLYSIQIPYTWYTVNDSFGSNFFYIKGATPGINNGNHDIQIEIPAGNYSPNDLTNKLLSSINTAKTTYTDISFGTTRISYDNNTAKSTLTLDINNIYNENSYYLKFPHWTTPYNLTDSSRCTINPSIPGFLGFEQQQYYPNTLYSKQYSNSTPTNVSYTLNATNNYFTVTKYIGPGNYVDISNNAAIFDLSFNIYVSTNGGRTTGSNGGGIGNITQSELLTDLNEQIKNNLYLNNESGIEYKAILVDPSNILTKYGYELKIKPNRKTTNNIPNSKIFIQFPTETGSSTIWTNTNSCFGFARTLNDINNIYGETQTVEQTDVYYISGTYIDLICINPRFNEQENHIRIDISQNTYASLTSYIRAINNGFDTAYNRTDNTKTPIADAILNVPDLTTYTYNANGPNTPTGTYAYIDSNNYFNIYLDINKKFDETMYTVDFSGSELNASNAPLGLSGPNNDNIYNCTTTGQTFTITTTASIVSGIYIPADSLIAKIFPRTVTNNGNQSDLSYEIRSTIAVRLYNATSIMQTINGYFANYIDLSTNIRIFSGITLSNPIINTDTTSFTLTININKVLTASSYNIQFIDDDDNSDHSWKEYLKLDASMVDVSMNLVKPDQTSINSASTGHPIITKNNNNVTITSKEPVPQSNQINIQTGINDTIQIIPYEDGVTDNTNKVTITIPPKYYPRDVLISTINTLFSQSISTSTDITQSTLNTYIIGDEIYVYFRMNVTRTYTAKDYNLVFYDPFSFVKCYAGVSSVRNTTWDSTLGWILGFHLYTVYYLSALESTNNIITITGDTVVNTNLYNYFMLCLDDYNQSHLNDGLVTISAVDTTVPLPTYASKDNFYCNPVTGQKVYNTTDNTNYSQLTQNQLYSITQIANSTTNNSNINGPSTNGKSYGVGPFVKDVFGLIPLKLTGLSPGQSFIEYGGTLQNQDRTYFGPVNIRRMSVKIVSDRGDVVNLNGANWSFSLLCDTLNNLNPSSSK